MLYTSRLWNGNYLNYNFILPKDRKLRRLFHVVTLPFIFAYLAICSSLLSVTLPFDAYRIARFKYYKNDKSLYRLFNNTCKHIIR